MHSKFNIIAWKQSIEHLLGFRTWTLPVPCGLPQSATCKAAVLYASSCTVWVSCIYDHEEWRPEDFDSIQTSSKHGLVKNNVPVSQVSHV